MRAATLRAQLMRGMKRALRVWVEGRRLRVSAAGARARSPSTYEKLAENQETDWDFAEDCLVTHGPAGVVNTVTGVCGLASMMWLYGVAWQQPMADSIAWTRSTIAEALPSSSTGQGQARTTASGELDKLLPAMPTISAFQPPKPAARATPGTVRPGGGRRTPRRRRARQSRRAAGTDAGFEAAIAERRARIEVLKSEGPRMLARRQRAARRRAVPHVDRARSRQRRRVALPRASAAGARACTRTRSTSFRKAKQHDPLDRSLDAAIDGAQRGIVADFQNRYRR